MVESGFITNTQVTGATAKLAEHTISEPAGDFGPAPTIATSLKGWVFVVNPSSSSGRTGKRWPRMLKTFKDAATAKDWHDVDELEVVMTSKPTEGLYIPASSNARPSLASRGCMCSLCLHARSFWFMS